MKQRKRWLSLAAAPFGLMAISMIVMGLFTPAPAMAASYTCQQGGNPPPASVTGDAFISESGACTLSGVTATGDITVSAGGTISAQTLSAGASISVTTSTGNITTGALTSNTNGSNGNILVQGPSNVSTGAITTSGGSGYGAVQIDANTNGGGAVFNIGGGGSNGVNGSIITSATTGGGSDPNFVRGGVFITNGNASSTGGITVQSMSNIQVTASASRSGIIFLNAQNGTLTLPTGTLSANGSSGQMAGVIGLLAKTITTADGTVISASQELAVTGSNHFAAIAATTVNVTGTNGLQVHADGNGGAGQAFSWLLPKGSVSISSNNDFHNLTWTLNSTGLFVTNAPMTVTGAAPFAMSANGDHSRVLVSGYPMTFSNTDVTIQARGAIDHEVDIGYSGALNGSVQFKLTGTGTATIDANGLNGAGGRVQVFGDKFTWNAPNINISANGPASGNGDSGSLFISSSALTLKTSSKAKITADAAIAGTGNSLTGATPAILFYPGTPNITVGNVNGSYSFSAKGGGTSGNGGEITINPNPGTITFKGNGAANPIVNVSAPGTTGNAGKVTFYTSTFAVTGNNARITANGGTTSGNGGEIHLFGNGTIDVGTGANALSFSATASGASNSTSNMAGTIEIAYATTLTADGPSFILTTGGNAGGGVVNVHDIGTITVTHTLKTEAHGNGKGGSITLNQTGYNTMTLDDATISASGKCNGSGDCGVVNISGPAKITAQAATIKADGFSGSNAGKVNIIGNTDSIDISGALISATVAAGNGNGGFVNISNNATIIDGVLNVANGANIHADGHGTGNGGQIRVTTGTNPGQGLVIAVGVASFTAQGGTNGEGGIVIIPTLQQMGANLFYQVNTYIKVSSGSGLTSASAFGGSISINGATCQRTLTTYAWPKFYWNCVNPGSPSGLDSQPAMDASTRIPGGIQAQQVNSNIYVFLDIAQYAQFFGWTQPADTAGITFAEPNSIVDITVEENTTFQSGYGSLTSSQLTESIIHEIGHASDFLSGLPSTSAGYNQSILDDQTYLNAAGGGQPCVAGSLGPLNGVIDNITQAQFCSSGGTGGTLNNPGGIYTGKTNSQIVAISTYLFAPKVINGNSGYPELYAQAFAYQDYVRGLANQTDFPFTATANGLFKKGYFQCAQAIGASLAGVAYGPPSYSCN